MAKPVLKVRQEKNGSYKATVPCTEMLSYVYEKNLPDPSISFNDIIKHLQDEYAGKETVEYFPKNNGR